MCTSMDSASHYSSCKNENSIIEPLKNSSENDNKIQGGRCQVMLSSMPSCLVIRDISWTVIKTNCLKTKTVQRCLIVFCNILSR